MKAQVVLTPTESKKLISKAVSRMDRVRTAMENGVIALHPSSSTYFLFEELTGTRPKTEIRVCGWVGPHGTCVEFGRAAAKMSGALEKGGMPLRTTRRISTPPW